MGLKDEAVLFHNPPNVAACVKAVAEKIMGGGVSVPDWYLEGTRIGITLPGIPTDKQKKAFSEQGIRIGGLYQSEGNRMTFFIELDVDTILVNAAIYDLDPEKFLEGV